MHLINIKEILPTEAECTTKVGQVENTEMKIKTETKTNVKKHVLCHMIRFLILTSVYKCFTSRACTDFPAVFCGYFSRSAAFLERLTMTIAATTLSIM